MSRGLGSSNPLIVSTFHSSIEGQFLVIVLVVVGLAFAWIVARALLLRRGSATHDLGADAASAALLAGGEPRARLALRVAFGVLWTLDGLLQLQPAMPLGLPGGVFQPAAAGAPSWVHRVEDVAVTVWSNHPITAATSAVWIQLGIGIALLVAPRGWWSRGAGIASATWGLAVWVFGEAVGGLFTPGASWLFGLPGAAILYVAAGVLLALPEGAWRGEALGRRLLRVMGIYFVGMGVLQAWPGRGTWAGRTAHGVTGLTAAWANQMVAVSQPGATRSAVRWFAALAADHAVVVNLVAVVALVGVGTCLVAGGRRLSLIGVVAGAALCLVTWVLVQDLGFFGGVGTDPNSMVPTASLLVVGLLALRYPAVAPAPAVRSRRTPAYLLQVAAALLAVAVVLLGAAPMAVAALNPHADAVLAEAVNGTPQEVDFPAWGFTLVNQRDQTVTLSQFAGRIVALTFLDPVCSTDCPLIAQELHLADRELAGTHPGIELVAIDANPDFRSVAALDAFDREDRLTHVRNWEYLTGSLGQLNRLWDDYGVSVLGEIAGAMAAHNDLVYVIGPTGDVRAIITSDPGGTSATASSLATLVAQQIQRVQSS